MRWLCALQLYFALSQAVTAQVQWVFIDPDSAWSSGNLVVEMEEGNLALFTSSDAPFSTDTLPYWPYIIKVTADGDLLAQQPYMFDGSPLRASIPQRLSSITGYISITTPGFPPELLPGLDVLRLDDELNILSRTGFVIVPDMQIGTSATCVDVEGDVIHCQAFDAIGTGLNFDHLLLWRISETGDSLAARIFAGDAFEPCTILPSPTGFDVLFHHAYGLGTLNGYGKVLQFDAQFNYVGGFAIPQFNGLPYELNQDSIPEIDELFRAPDGGFFVTGRMLEFTPIIDRAFVMQLTPDGTLVNVLFSPDMGLPPNTVFNGFLPLNDGTYAWGVTGSAVWPDDQARSYVYKVDENLGIIGHVELNEAAFGGGPNARQMIITQDGGIAICGTLQGPGTDPHGWVAKLGEFVGTDDDAAATTLMNAYPNPGDDQLTIRFQSTTHGEVTLYDVRGRAVKRSGMIAGYAEIPTDDLAPGLYQLLLRDPAGRESGRGRWVKE